MKNALHSKWKDNFQTIMNMIVCIFFFFFNFLCLILTAFIVKNSHVLAEIYITFLEKVLDQTWKAFNTKFGH